MRRVYRVVSAPDFSPLDEPVFSAGTAPVTFRRLVHFALAAAILGAGLAAASDVGLGFDPVLFAATLAAAGVALAAMLHSPLESRPPLTLALARTRAGRAEPEEGEVYRVEAGDDGLAVVELAGYAFDPATGRPLEAVDIVVDGVTYTVETEAGRYFAELELARGTHEVEVRAHGTGVTLRRLLLVVS